jgi:hypothetical protein
MLVVVPALQTLFLERTDRLGQETREDGKDFAEACAYPGQTVSIAQRMFTGSPGQAGRS